MSYHYFRELFKRHTGNSPYQYHLARRLDRAQTLLAESELTIKEVAEALHFNDAYHFSKTFKARTGRSPSRWRRRDLRSAPPLAVAGHTEHKCREHRTGGQEPWLLPD